MKNIMFAMLLVILSIFCQSDAINTTTTAVVITPTTTTSSNSSTEPTTITTTTTITNISTTLTNQKTDPTNQTGFNTTQSVNNDTTTTFNSSNYTSSNTTNTTSTTMSSTQTPAVHGMSATVSGLVSLVVIQFIVIIGLTLYIVYHLFYKRRYRTTKQADDVGEADNRNASIVTEQNGKRRRNPTAVTVTSADDDQTTTTTTTAAIDRGVPAAPPPSVQNSPQLAKQRTSINGSTATRSDTDKSITLNVVEAEPVETTINTGRNSAIRMKQVSVDVKKKKSQKGRKSQNNSSKLKRKDTPAVPQHTYVNLEFEEGPDKVDETVEAQSDQGDDQTVGGTKQKTGADDNDSADFGEFGSDDEHTTTTTNDVTKSRSSSASGTSATNSSQK